MTHYSVIRKEERLYCYVSEIPLPSKFITRPAGTKFVNAFYDSWFSSANKYPVKDEEAMLDFLWDLKVKENNGAANFDISISEGIQITYEAVEIIKDYSGCNKENMIPLEYAVLSGKKEDHAEEPLTELYNWLLEKMQVITANDMKSRIHSTRYHTYKEVAEKISLLQKQAAKKDIEK